MGFGSVEPTTIMYNFTSSVVGSILLGDAPQLIVMITTICIMMS